MTTNKVDEIPVALIEICREGVRMVLKKVNRMHTLSDDEKSRLIELIVEEFGIDLAFDNFAEVIHGLFEDIPGLETIEPIQANHLINQLWSQYHGKKHC